MHDKRSQRRAAERPADGRPATRRHFLAGAVTGGLASALTAPAAWASTAEEVPAPGDCQLEASPADALNTYRDRLTTIIRSEFYRATTLDLLELVRRSACFLSLVRRLLEKLDKELGREGANAAAAVQIDFCLGQASVVASSPAAGEQTVAGTYTSALGELNTQLERTAQETLPKDLSTLRPAARATLEEILGAVRDSRALEELLNRRHAEVTTAMSRLDELLQAVRQDLWRASAHILEVENPFDRGDKSDSRKKALAGIESARRRLASIVNTTAPSPTPPPEVVLTINLFSSLLAGCAEWVTQIETRTLAGARAESREPAFVRASLAAAAVDVDAELRRAIKSNMWRYCRGGSSQRVETYFTNVVKPLYEDARAHAGRVRRQVAFAIYLPVAVMSFRLQYAVNNWTGIGCEGFDLDDSNYQPQPGMLADALANLIDRLAKQTA